jgi:hypothetical protein
MKTENKNNEANIVLGTDSGVKIVMPLRMDFQPKEDITTYELAMCLPYFFRAHGVMPGEIDMELPHFRHFEITNNNDYKK